MELVERYLGAVRWNLPADKADDIVAELADVIANRIEEREDRLGRPLSRGEVAEVLKDLGHPLQVAGRYREQRHLIGPEVFPFYWFVLRVWLAVVAVIGTVELVARALIGGAPWFAAFDASGLIESLFINAAVVTLIFAVVEHTGWLSTYLERWKPEELPRLELKRAPRRRLEPVFEIVFGIGFILWWLGALPILTITNDARVAVSPAPVWQTLHWPVVGLVALGILQGIVALLAPAAKPVRAALLLTQAAATVALAWIAYQAGRLVVLSSGSLAAAEVADIQQHLDMALRIAVVIVPVVVVASCGGKLWRLARER